MPAVCFLSNCYPREGSAQLKPKIHSRRRQCTFEEQLRNLEDYRFIATMFSCIITSIIGLSGSIRVITFTVSIMCCYCEQKYLPLLVLLVLLSAAELPLLLILLPIDSGLRVLGFGFMTRPLLTLW